MSRFYASIKGNRGRQATRQGTSNSGISGHIKGRDIGVKVVGQVNERGEDEFEVLLTSGTNTSLHKKRIGIFIERNLRENNTLKMDIHQQVHINSESIEALCNLLGVEISFRVCGQDSLYAEANYKTSEPKVSKEGGKQ